MTSPGREVNSAVRGEGRGKCWDQSNQNFISSGLLTILVLESSSPATGSWTGWQLLFVMFTILWVILTHFYNHNINGIIWWWCHIFFTLYNSLKSKWVKVKYLMFVFRVCVYQHCVPALWLRCTSDEPDHDVHHSQSYSCGNLLLHYTSLRPGG